MDHLLKKAVAFSPDMESKLWLICPYFAKMSNCSWQSRINWYGSTPSQHLRATGSAFGSGTVAVVSAANSVSTAGACSQCEFGRDPQNDLLKSHASAWYLSYIPCIWWHLFEIWFHASEYQWNAFLWLVWNPIRMYRHRVCVLMTISSVHKSRAAKKRVRTILSPSPLDSLFNPKTFRRPPTDRGVGSLEVCFHATRPDKSISIHDWFFLGSYSNKEYSWCVQWYL